MDYCFKTLLHELMTGRRRVNKIDFGLQQAQPQNEKEKILPHRSKAKGIAAEPEIK